MTSLKDLRDSIATVKTTQKITRAMQTVAAAKLRRAQEAVIAARPYSEGISIILQNIHHEVKNNENMPCLVLGTGLSKTQLVVVFTSELGLCGGFNVQIVRSARDFIQKNLIEGRQIKIITVGKKGADILNRDFGHLIIHHVNLQNTKHICFSHACKVSRKIISLFHAKEFDICTLFYSHFHSVIRQQPVSKQLIPLLIPIDKQKEEKVAVSGVYEYEPDAISILDDLGSKNITVQVFHAMLENMVGEIGAKMNAMDNATRNAGEMINKRSIIYNRQRQAQITTELIEIIAGAEAL